MRGIIYLAVRRTFMEWKYFVEIVAVLIMVGGVGGIFYGVFKGTITLSFRTIQFLAIAFGVPAIMILSMERSIGNEATAALIGMIVGYALSGIGRSE
jgi:hypothetical protein